MAGAMDDIQASGSRPAYEAPRAMRMGHVPDGKGACTPQGSGDADCMDGNSAFPYCDEAGLSAEGCYADGSSASEECDIAGAGY